METIILFIIIGIISSLFKKDKNQPTKQRPAREQMPSFGQQSVPEKSKPVMTKQKPAVKTLEEFANEIFGQLNEKEKQQQKPVQIPPTVQEVVEKVEEKIERPAVVARQSTRPPLGERPITKKIANESISFKPKSRNDLVQGLVMAEILGPPKAKRK